MARPRGRPAGGGGHARPLTHDEISRLTHNTSVRDRCFLWLGLGGGLRVGEICTILRTHIASDLSILIPRELAKSDRTRRVYLCAEAKLYLAQYLSQYPGNDNDPLFPSRTGRATMTPSWGSRLVQGIFQDHGITGASSHSLRRTHANGLRQQGADLLVIRQQLGHADIATTEQYLQLIPHEQPETVDKLKL